MLKRIALQYKDAAFKWRHLCEVPYRTFEAHQKLFMAKSRAHVVFGQIPLSQQSLHSYNRLHCLRKGKKPHRNHVLKDSRLRKDRYRLSNMLAMLLLLHTSAQGSSTAYQCMEKSQPPSPALSAERKEEKKVRVTLGEGQPSPSNGCKSTTASV